MDSCGAMVSIDVRQMIVVIQRVLTTAIISCFLNMDDMLITRSNIQEINNLQKQLSKQFAMKDLGAAKQILGMKIAIDKVASI
jgi:hypothetical protein